MRLETGLEAAQRASDHADRASIGVAWSKLAWLRMLEFVSAARATQRELQGPAKQFTTDDFRTWATERALPEPPDARAFGNVTKKAQRRGMIRKTDHRDHAGAQAHGREVTVWSIT